MCNVFIVIVNCYDCIIFYRVVSPKDLAVVGKNKQKHKKVEIQTETVKPIKTEDIHNIESHEEQKVLEVHT